MVGSHYRDAGRFRVARGLGNCRVRFTTFLSLEALSTLKSRLNLAQAQELLLHVISLSTSQPAMEPHRIPEAKGSSLQTTAMK